MQGRHPTADGGWLEPKSWLVVKMEICKSRWQNCKKARPATMARPATPCMTSEIPERHDKIPEIRDRLHPRRAHSWVGSSPIL